MKKGYAAVVVAAAVAVVVVAIAVAAAVGNEAEVVLEVVVGNNAALDGDVEREHYHVAEFEVAKPVEAAGNEVVVAAASVHHRHPIHLQTHYH